MAMFGPAPSDPLRRRVAASARRTDNIGLFGLGLLLEEVADETTSLHTQQDGFCRSTPSPSFFSP